MDRAKFYNKVRGTLFRGSISAEQFAGMENLLDVWDQYYSDQRIDNLSYNLATTYHETARKMQPIYEYGPRSYFNKYDAGTRLGRILGNTVKGDGYRFRGAGHVQNTGRRNAKVATERLNKAFNLGVDLVKNPDKRLDPFISAHSLFLGNLQGWWTGKGLDKYLDDDDRDEFNDYMRARYVVNGTDKRSTIAGYAVRFENALREAGYKPKPPGTKPEKPIEKPVPTVKSTVRKGDKNEYVEILIKALHEMGYYHGKMDDYFWTATDAAVRKFQRDKGLKADGIVGPKTWASIEKAYDARKLRTKVKDTSVAATAAGAVAASSLAAMPSLDVDWGAWLLDCRMCGCFRCRFGQGFWRLIC